MTWYVLESYDTDNDGECDSLRKYSNGSVWNNDFGHVGSRIFMAADVGSGTLDDLVYVELPVKPGDQKATWWVSYNDGLGHFSGDEAVVPDNLVTGSEQHWTGKVFGIGSFKATDTNPDFITLLGSTTGSAVTTGLSFRMTTGSQWRSSGTEGSTLPGTNAISTQPTSGGTNIRDLWWCPACNEW
jgi:hypothetical protein